MKDYGGPIEFRLGTSPLRSSHLLWGLAIALGLPLLFVLITFLVVAAGSADLSELAEGLAAAWNSADNDDLLHKDLLLGLLIALASALYLKMHRACYLKLTDVGLEANVHKWLGLGRQKLSTGHWRVHWDLVRSIRLVPGKHTGKPALQVAHYRLIVETGRGQQRLAPFLWILPGGPDHRLTLREILPFRGFDAAKVVERAPLVQALRAWGIEFSSEPIGSEKARAGYDLAKHPGMVTQLVLFFFAGAYALIDWFFLAPFLALEPLPAAPFVIATVAGTAMAFLLGKGAPTRERWVVGALMVVLLTAAAHPGLLRVNAMTAKTQEIPYRAVALGQFESTVPGYPEIDLRKLHISEYWSEYPEGSEHQFDLLRGAGGFFQVDLRPLYARSREFYSLYSRQSEHD